MAIDLDRLEQRIVGVLIEKQMAVPDSYPLTLNAIVAGCNQKNNREPRMAVEPYEAEGALSSLMEKGWVRRLDMEGGRVLRFEHRAAEQLGVEDVELVMLTELLIRGPQTPGELKTRAGRMKPQGSPADVEQRLGDLAGRPVPYVRRLERRPREHAARWEHCLGASGEAEEAADAEVPQADAERPAETHAADPRRVPPPPQAVRAEPALIDRIESLERAVDELHARLRRLEGGEASRD